MITIQKEKCSMLDLGLTDKLWRRYCDVREMISFHFLTLLYWINMKALPLKFRRLCQILSCLSTWEHLAGWETLFYFLKTAAECLDKIFGDVPHCKNSVFFYTVEYKAVAFGGTLLNHGLHMKITVNHP